MEAKGGTLLKVMGIIMIVGGALNIILSIVLIAAVAALIAMGAPGGIIVGIIITILGGIAELIAGIICTKNARNAEKATKCMVWCIIVIALQLIGVIITAIGAGAMAKSVGATLNNGGSTVVSIILGMVVPVIAIIAAVMNKKSYDASRGVQTSFASVVGDVANEVKEMDDDVVGLAKEAKDTAANVVDDVKDFAGDAVEKVGDVVDDVKDKAADVVDDVKEKAADVVDDVKDVAEDAKDKVGDVVEDVKDKFDGEN